MKPFNRCRKKHHKRLSSNSSAPAHRVKKTIGRRRPVPEDPTSRIQGSNLTVADAKREITSQVEILVSSSNSIEADRAASKRAIEILSGLATEEEMANLIVECGAVPPLVRHLQSPEPVISGPIPLEHEVEEGSALTLGLLAFKPEHQQLIVDAGALPLLVDLLKRQNPRAANANGAMAMAALALSFLAHNNSSIQTHIGNEGGIPPLVELLESDDKNIQASAAEALKSLAIYNDENMNQIVECDALPKLIPMLGSNHAGIQYNVLVIITVLGNAAIWDIAQQVVAAGALQSVIRLLKSSRLDIRGSAASLLGQFAHAESNYRVHIAQRGALMPLIHMLSDQDPELKKGSAYALANLAWDNTNNQAGIASCGGVKPLVNLLDSKYTSFHDIQRYASFVLCELAGNEDSVVDVIKFGGVQKLQDGEFNDHRIRDNVEITLQRLEEKIQGSGQVLDQLLYLIREDEKDTQRWRVIHALAHLCSADDLTRIFIDNNGLDLLFELLELENIPSALSKLAQKVAMISPIDDVAFPSPPQVYLAEQYVNNPTLSDVTFLVEGKRFHAHRICLLASSDAFRAMFDGGYRERQVEDIEIPNFTWQVFELMMRYTYTGSVDVANLDLNVAQDLLRAADQYLLEGLKRLCENAIAQHLSVENVSEIFNISQAFNATSLSQACILFILENYESLSCKSDYLHLIQRISQETRQFFHNLLGTLTQAVSMEDS